MDLRMHSHEFKFLFHSQWISECIPMSSYSPANESQDSECIPMSSYSPANESQDSECIPMEITHPKILESFGWVHPCPTTLIQECP